MFIIQGAGAQCTCQGFLLFFLHFLLTRKHSLAHLIPVRASMRMAFLEAFIFLNLFFIFFYFFMIDYVLRTQKHTVFTQKWMIMKIKGCSIPDQLNVNLENYWTISNHDDDETTRTEMYLNVLNLQTMSQSPMVCLKWFKTHTLCIHNTMLSCMDSHFHDHEKQASL